MVEYGLGEPGKAYAKWSAEMALGLGTQVPWVMCKQDDAPDPVVRSHIYTYIYIYFIFLTEVLLIIFALYNVFLSLAQHRCPH